MILRLRCSGGSKKRDTLERSLLNESDDLDDDAIGALGTDSGGGASGGADGLPASGGGSGVDKAAARKRRRYNPSNASDGMRIRVKPGRKAGWQASAMAEAAAAEYGEASEGTRDGEDNETASDGSTVVDRTVPGNERENRKCSIGMAAKVLALGGAGNAAYPVNLMSTATIQGNFQILVGGCTTFVAGDGCLLSRTVDASANVFYGEHKKRNHRKAILKQELQHIAASLALLQSYAAGHPHPPPRMGHHPSTLGRGNIGGKTFTQVYSQNRDYHPVKQAATKPRKRVSKPEPRDDDDRRDGTSDGDAKVRRKPGPMKGWKLAAAAAGALDADGNLIETGGKGPGTRRRRGSKPPKVPAPKPEHKPRRGRIPTVHDPNLPRKGKMTVSMASLELQHFKALKAFADTNADIDTASEQSDHPTEGRSMHAVVPPKKVVKDIVHDGRAPRPSSKPLADGLDLAGRGKGVKGGTKQPKGAAAGGAGAGRSNGGSKQSQQGAKGDRAVKAVTSQTTAAAATAAAAAAIAASTVAEETEEDDDGDDDDDDDDSDGGELANHHAEAAGTEEDEGAETESDDDGDLEEAEEVNHDLDDDDEGEEDAEDSIEGEGEDEDGDDDDDDDAAFVEQFNAANTLKHMTNPDQEADDEDEDDEDEDEDEDGGPMEYEDDGDEFDDDEEEEEEEEGEDEPQLDASNQDGGDDDEEEEEEEEVVQEYDDDDDDDDDDDEEDDQR